LGAEMRKLLLAAAADCAFFGADAPAQASTFTLTLEQVGLGALGLLGCRRRASGE